MIQEITGYEVQKIKQSPSISVGLWDALLCIHTPPSQHL